MKYCELMKTLDSIIPFNIQEKWDNSGVQIRTGREYINRILLCLEINEKVVDEAVSSDVDMIISHHPMFFAPVKLIDTGKFPGNCIRKLFKAGIDVCSFHTNFDKVKGGNNDYLANLLGLCDIKPMKDCTYESVENTITRMGTLKNPLTAKDAILLVSKALNLEKGRLRLSGYGELTVKQIGVCTGAGSEFISLAATNGCDMFITGDVKYHEGQNARNAGILVADAGHYNTESFFPKAFVQLAGECGISAIEFIESNVNLDPFVLI